MIDQIIGYVAAAITTSAFVPQVIKVLRHKDTKAISLSTYLILAVGVSTWLAYGIMVESYPIIVANSLTLSLIIMIIAVKLKNRD